MGGTDFIGIIISWRCPGSSGFGRVLPYFENKTKQTLQAETKLKKENGTGWV
jgi:hypothetical protein